MKILVPLNSKDCVRDYVSAGADEFYFGFFDEEWTNKFGEYSDLNRMSSFRRNANSLDFTQAMEAVKEIKSYGKSCFLTFNANLYTEEELEYIDGYFAKLKECGVDGVILSDYQLVKYAIKRDLLPVASTMCGLYNEDTIRFYQKRGIRRMIVPRELSLEDIKELSAGFPEISFEVFFMRNGCIYSDSNCLCQHIRGKGGICAELRNSDYSIAAKGLSPEEMRLLEETKYCYDEDLMRPNACGQCALYLFYQMGISSLKIVGRADPQSAILEDIVLTKKNIEIVKTCSSQEEYLKHMIRADSMKSKKCNKGLNCYYPEARFGKGC